jgi:hypothetical protein
MKAYVFHRYGGPEVVELAEVEKPTPGEREVLWASTKSNKSAIMGPASWCAWRTTDSHTGPHRKRLPAPWTGPLAECSHGRLQEVL